MERRDVIIIASVSAIYGLGDPKSYMKMLLHLRRGDLMDQRAILRRLAELQPAGYGFGTCRPFLLSEPPQFTGIQ